MSKENTYEVRYKSPMMDDPSLPPVLSLHSVHNTVEQAKAAVLEFKRNVVASALDNRDKHTLLKGVTVL
jgi:hypothetical protein